MANPRDLNYYKSLNYRIELFFDPEDKVWYAEFPELAGCLAHGATKEEALANAAEAKEAWLEATFETGRDIPEPRPEIEYSGRFLLRVPKSLHQKLATEAGKEGTSINRLAIQILSEELERRQTMRAVTDSIQVAVRDAFAESSKVPYMLKWLATSRPGGIADRFREMGILGSQISDVFSLENLGPYLVDQNAVIGLVRHPIEPPTKIRFVPPAIQILRRFEKSEEEEA